MLGTLQSSCLFVPLQVSFLQPVATEEEEKEEEEELQEKQAAQVVLAYYDNVKWHDMYFQVTEIILFLFPGIPPKSPNTGMYMIIARFCALFLHVSCLTKNS